MDSLTERTESRYCHAIADTDRLLVDCRSVQSFCDRKLKDAICRRRRSTLVHTVVYSATFGPIPSLLDMSHSVQLQTVDPALWEGGSEQGVYGINNLAKAGLYKHSNRSAGYCRLLSLRQAYSNAEIFDWHLATLKETRSLLQQTTVIRNILTEGLSSVYLRVIHEQEICAIAKMTARCALYK